MPDGLEDVSKYPDLVAELLRRGWTEEEIKAALAYNFLRVFQEVEAVSVYIVTSQCQVSATKSKQNLGTYKKKKGDKMVLLT